MVADIGSDKLIPCHHLAFFIDQLAEFDQSVGIGLQITGDNQIVRGGEPLTLTLSLMIVVTFAQFLPTDVTLPTRPAPAITFIFSMMPSSVPLSMTNE